jgi:branched-chain amino acid transport system ATP-binding protein
MNILEVKDLSLSFGKFSVLNGVDFAVEEGEIFGIAGPNGAGKTTLFNAITGFYHGSGRILFENRRIDRLSPHRICHYGISRTWQVPELFASLSVEDNVQVGAHFGRRRGAREASEKAEIASAIEVVGLKGRERAGLDGLNLFEKKLTMIAAALATRPQVLLLDEPVGGLSPKEVGESVALFRRINEELGLTVIIIEHVMRVLTEVADRMLILSSGQNICCGSPAEVCADERIIQLYLGSGYVGSKGS